MSSAGAMLQAAAIEALKAIEGLGVYEGPPVQAAFPYAVVEAGPESDWSHKSGEGREVRIALVIHDKGERPTRLRALAAQGEAILGALDGEMGGWRLVTIAFLRSRLAAEGRSSQGKAAAIEYRARMLRT